MRVHAPGSLPWTANLVKRKKRIGRSEVQGKEVGKSCMGQSSSGNGPSSSWITLPDPPAPSLLLTPHRCILLYSLHTYTEDKVERAPSPLGVASRSSPSLLSHTNGPPGCCLCSHDRGSSPRPTTPPTRQQRHERQGAFVLLQGTSCQCGALRGHGALAHMLFSCVRYVLAAISPVNRHMWSHSLTPLLVCHATTSAP